MTRTAPIPAEIVIDTSPGWAVICPLDALDIPRPLVPVRLNGEPMVLFRDDRGTLGLVGRHCPHRGADLCYGRLEDNGLRCPFHGWHFASSGQCLEQPAEPEGSQMYKAIKLSAVSLEVRNGEIWARVPEERPG